MLDEPGNKQESTFSEFKFLVAFFVFLVAGALALFVRYVSPSFFGIYDQMGMDTLGVEGFIQFILDYYVISTVGAVAGLLIIFSDSFLKSESRRREFLVVLGMVFTLILMGVLLSLFIPALQLIEFNP
jgi:membrane associated rhomboid family serine protease